MADKRIKVTKNGPYFVSGVVPLSQQTIVPDTDGESFEWIENTVDESRESYVLCRCGGSKTKPYCDGAHFYNGFDGTETARKVEYLEVANRYEGATMDLLDQEDLCANARFCHRSGGVWNTVLKTEQDEVKKDFIMECNNCPSGRYTAFDKQTGQIIEPDLPKSIGLVQDEKAQCSGPLWVRGGIIVESEKGEIYDVRNRQTLCRCGQSKNKPFCDGAHIEARFHDQH